MSYHPRLKLSSFFEKVHNFIFCIFSYLVEKDKDVYAVFVDLEKAFDRVDWKKTHGDPGENWYGLEGEEALK